MVESAVSNNFLSSHISLEVIVALSCLKTPRYCVGTEMVLCSLEFGNKCWVQNCNFTSYTCKMNCTVTNCEHVPNNISFEVCGQNCNHTNTLLVDQCSEQINEGGYHTCNVTECNLAIGEEEYEFEQAYFFEGGQCDLKCNGIRCPQICKEGEDGERSVYQYPPLPSYPPPSYGVTP